MYIVIADGKVLFSTDVDDVAWEVKQEREDDFEKIYIEEVGLREFDAEGIYITTSEDKITLQEIVNAEQYFRDEELRPKLRSTPPQKKKKKKASRKYWEEMVDSLSSNAAKRMLSKLGLPFANDEDELTLKEVLEAKLRSMVKQDDDYSDSIFEELGACSTLVMNIDSLTRFASEEESRRILTGVIEKIEDSIVPEGDEFELGGILFDCISRKADCSQRSMQEIFDEIKDQK